MWGLPLFDVKEPVAILFEMNMARQVKSNYYIKVVAFDNTRGTESSVLAFIVGRPTYEPGFRLNRQEGAGRNIIYTLESYATMNPSGTRYGNLT